MNRAVNIVQDMDEQVWWGEEESAVGTVHQDSVRIFQVVKKEAWHIFVAEETMRCEVEGMVVSYFV